MAQVFAEGGHIILLCPAKGTIGEYCTLHTKVWHDTLQLVLHCTSVYTCMLF